MHAVGGIHSPPLIGQESMRGRGLVKPGFTPSSPDADRSRPPSPTSKTPSSLLPRQPVRQHRRARAGCLLRRARRMGKVPVGARGGLPPSSSVPLPLSLCLSVSIAISIAISVSVSISIAISIAISIGLSGFLLHSKSNTPYHHTQDSATPSIDHGQRQEWQQLLRHALSPPPSPTDTVPAGSPGCPLMEKAATVAPPSR